MEQRPQRGRPSGFADLMRPGERLAALIYLPVDVFAMPLLLLPLLWRACPGMSTVDLNLAYYCIGFAFVFISCRRFLRAGFDRALDAPGAFFVSVFGAFALQFALSLVFSAVIYLLLPEGLSSPNNEAIEAMIPQGLNKLVAISVFLGPIVEEVLFRGLIYGALRRRSRALAWAVSIAAFSLYHVWQFALTEPLMLVTAVLYIPASAALNWSYERSGSIWAPIAFHMLTNAIGLA